MLTIAIAAVLLSASQSATPATAGVAGGAAVEEKMALKIESGAFGEGATIPAKHTCDGADVSPAVTWSGAPAGTKSFALISDDPDAPVGTWVHWVLFDLPGTASGLPEGVPKDKELKGGGRQGITDFRRIGYGGPCPPPGKPHRYYFKLYALDKELGLPAGATKKEVEKAIEGHVLAQAQIMGKYGR